MATRDLNLAKQLHDARESAGLTQDALGQRLGIGRTAVSRIESGKRSPRAPVISRWLEECGFLLDVVDPGGPDRAKALGLALGALDEHEVDDVLMVVRAWPRLAEARRQRILGLVEAPEA